MPNRRGCVLMKTKDDHAPEIMLSFSYMCYHVVFIYTHVRWIWSFSFFVSSSMVIRPLSLFSILKPNILSQLSSFFSKARNMVVLSRHSLFPRHSILLHLVVVVVAFLSLVFFRIHSLPSTSFIFQVQL